MKQLLLLCVAVALALAAIPATIIDAGTKNIPSPRSNSGYNYEITYNAVFTVQPSFTTLLSDIGMFSARGNPMAYQITLSTTLTSGNILIIDATDRIQVLTFRWVASQGEHLQLFPSNHYVQSGDTSTTPAISDIPFDYPSLVQWSPGTFEVAITAVIQSFVHRNEGTSFKAEISIAKWSGAGYGYSGDGPLILSNSALYGANCPFTTSENGNNVAKMYVSMSANAKVYFTLIFHKVQVTRGLKTGFGVVRTHSRDHTTGTYSDDISNTRYNPVTTNPAAVRIYGFESFSLEAPNHYINIMSITTTDGVNTIGQHDTDPTGTAYTAEFYASYLYAPIPTCPPGCVCESGIICSSCILGKYRVAAPVTIDETAVCPCINGFYENADGACKPCIKSAYCDTCDADYNYVLACTACKCEHSRELNNGQCVCQSGYTNASPIGPYCVQVMTPQ